MIKLDVVGVLVRVARLSVRATIAREIIGVTQRKCREVGDRRSDTRNIFKCSVRHYSK